MYVALQIAAFSALCEPFLPLHQLNYQEYWKSKVRWVGTRFQKHLILFAGHQIGEAELFCQKNENSETNWQTRNN
jgi:hypothetical protein